MKARIVFYRTTVGNQERDTFGDQTFCHGAQTSDVFLDECYLIHSIELLLKTRGILGITDSEGPVLEQTLQDCRTAFQKSLYLLRRPFVGEHSDGLCRGPGVWPSA
jgi:hypothetical protein